MKPFKTKHLLLVAIFAFGLGAFVAPQNDKYFEIIKNLDIFATLFKEVNAQYVDEINPNTFMQTGIDAMMSSLDPYTRFYPEDEIEDVRTQTTEQFGSIGATFRLRKGKITVILPNGEVPYDSLGLHRGDEIIEVNGLHVKGDIERAKGFLRGQSSSHLKLKVLREGRGEIDLEVALSAEERLNVPYYGMLTGDVGVIKQTGFMAGASIEVTQAMQALKGRGATKIILDLRGNPGGLLNEAVNVSNIFLPKGELVVNVYGKTEETNVIYKSLNDPEDLEIPLVVMTNSSSASAAEIVAGVVQDYDRGVLVGQQSFGKGLVQRTMPLSYNSQMKITIAKYYVPSGRCIQAIDYGNRNPDGSVGKIADSLMARFQTRNGRPVYDGGGIMPDFEVKKRRFAPITEGILSADLFFDFGNEYELQIGTVSSPKEFQITDRIYHDFKTWLADKEFSYSGPLAKQLVALRSVAEQSGELNGISRELERLEAAAGQDRNSDLDKNKEEIKFMLKEEFVTRFFFNQGRQEASYQYDNDTKKALEILADPKRYRKTLASPEDQ